MVLRCDEGPNDLLEPTWDDMMRPLLDGDIFGARSFTDMGRGATTEHESDVSRTEVEENSHDTTTVINSQIRI